jgi:histidine triad (HIT) family protein
MTSIFTKIIQSEIPAHIVWEDEDLFLMLDIKPMRKGHLLLITKAEVDKIYDLDEGLYNKLFSKAKEVSLIIEKEITKKFPELNITRVAYAVEGYGVPHAHLHLVPLSKQHEFLSGNNYVATKEELDEMKEFYSKIFN